MNFIKRAILSSKARLGKTAILFAVMFTISIVSLASFGIQSATEQSSILARQELGAEVSLIGDIEKLRNEMMNNQSGQRMKITQVPVPLEYLDELKDSEYVEEYLLATTMAVSSNDVLAVGEEEISSDSSGGMGAMGPMRGSLTINGVNEMILTEEAKEGNMEILEGREITAEDENSNVAVIEETLASENNLSIGDTIEVYNPMTPEETIQLEVIGIYKNYSEFTTEAFMNVASSPFNQIYVPYKTVSGAKGEDYANAVDKIVFYLDDPVNVEQFIKDGENTSIDFDTFKLDGNSAAYEAMMGPIENVASFASTASLLITIFGGVILALIIMLSIKERMNEIGILLSLGEGKIKIIGQFLTEVLLVLVISLGVAGVSGGPVSNVISSQLLASEIQAESEQEDSLESDMRPMGGNKFGFTSAPDVDAIEELNVDITSEDFIGMSLVAMLVAIIATIIPCSFIMRLHPKTILSKHN